MTVNKGLRKKERIEKERQDKLRDTEAAERRREKEWAAISHNPFHRDDPPPIPAQKKKLSQIVVSATRRLTYAEERLAEGRRIYEESKARKSLREKEERESASAAATHSMGVPLPNTKRYAGDMAKREAAAQEEIARKRKQVGILVNKSTYQYITEGMDLTTLGKK